MKLTLYMTRHGLSCSNILHHKDLRLNPLNGLYKDPFLSKKGVEQSTRSSSYLSEKIGKVDLVLCSPLVRAIETSVLMFPNQDVYVCPYICENGKSLENVPYSI